MGICKHELFEAQADVNRLADVGRFMVDLKVSCAQCGTPLRFLGLPIGMHFDHPMVSLDGTEIRLPAHPVNETVPKVPDDVLKGFSVKEGPPH